MIFLGNLSIHDIEKRSGIKFPDALVDLMESTWQEEATNVKPGKWHCFDVPFAIVCGDMKFAEKIYRYLEKYSKDFKEPLQIIVASRG